MLKNYLISSIRNFVRYKLYTFINVSGLAIGFATFMLIFIYVQHEWSFDKFHEKSDIVVKANLEFGTGPDDIEPVDVTPSALLPDFTERFPEVTGGTRYFNPSSFSPSVIKKDGQVFQEVGFAYADSTFFDVFSFEVVAGNKNSALVEPYSVILTKSAVKKYFREEDPMNKGLTINSREYIVKGIMNDPPDNSHLQFSMLGSFTSHPISKKPVWWSANYFTYLTLTSKEAIQTLEPKIQPYLLEIEYSQPEQGFYANAKMVPLEDVYLKSEADALSDIRYVYIFMVIGVLILVIASINYMNLATARSITRSKEVGVRKVTGASKLQLITQFLSESIIISFIAYLFSIVIVAVSLQVFNVVAGKSISFDYVLQPSFYLPMMAVVLAIGLISGVYPAFLLSSFRPVSILKGGSGNTSRGVLLRKALVIVQFGVSIIMIIATLVVGSQMKFIQNKQLGYDKESIISIPINRDLMNKQETFKSEMKSTGYVSEVTMALETPVTIMGGYSIWGEGTPEDFSYSTTAVAVDDDYLNTFNIELIAGRNFDANDEERSKIDKDGVDYSFILNRSAVETLGWQPEEAIDKRVNLDGREGKVVGVIENFHFQSLHQKIGPLVMFVEMKWGYNYAMLKLDGDLNKAINAVGEKWSALTNDMPYEYSFIDERVATLYKQEKSMSEVFIFFSSITVFVACLGLFGLASFVSYQKSKEVSIRKVLGASINGLVFKLSKDFIYLVIGAFLIGAPLAYMMMNNWLAGFEYRTSIQVWQMAAALFSTCLIAFITVSYHALKSASANPADVLKND